MRSGRENEVRKQGLGQEAILRSSHLGAVSSMYTLLDILTRKQDCFATSG